MEAVEASLASCAERSPGRDWCPELSRVRATAGALRYTTTLAMGFVERYRRVSDGE